MFGDKALSDVKTDWFPLLSIDCDVSFFMKSNLDLLKFETYIFDPTSCLSESVYFLAESGLGVSRRAESCLEEFAEAGLSNLTSSDEWIVRCLNATFLSI